MLVLLFLSALSLANCKNCVQNFCLPENYSRLELPARRNEVRMQFDVLDVLEVDDKNFALNIFMYFGVIWTEQRIISEANLEQQWTPIDMDFLQSLWVPNVFVYNLKSFKALECLQKLAGIWIVGQRDLFYNLAVHVSFMCPMRFNAFPLDEHVCRFMVGSSNYDDTRMTFVTTQLSFNSSKTTTILDYSIRLHPLRPEDQIQPYGDAGNYSVTGFEVHLERNLAKYIYLYYLPSGLFVIVSWASFLINPENVPGRMGLLITLFLVLVNIFNTVTTVSPNVEGLTALAAWMSACILFVFAALLEYACLLLITRRKRRRWLRLQLELLSSVHSRSCPLHPLSLKHKSEECEEMQQRRHLANIDAKCFVAAPCVFVMFNALYWPLCVNK